MRTMRLVFTLLFMLLVAACAAPVTSSDQAAQAQPASEATPAPILPPTNKAPPSSSQDAKAKNSEVVVDYSCKQDNECVIKDVGNCCGSYPACVNANSPTDPAGVQARCQAQGMVGVCGFPSISSCQCVQGRCTGKSDAGNGLPVIR